MVIKLSGELIKCWLLITWFHRSWTSWIFQSQASHNWNRRVFLLPPARRRRFHHVHPYQYHDSSDSCCYQYHEYLLLSPFAPSLLLYDCDPPAFLSPSSALLSAYCATPNVSLRTSQCDSFCGSAHPDNSERCRVPDLCISYAEAQVRGDFDNRPRLLT